MAAGADNADQAEDQGEDPARGTGVAMTLAGVAGEEEGGGVDCEFKDRDSTPGVELHFG